MNLTNGGQNVYVEKLQNISERNLKRPNRMEEKKLFKDWETKYFKDANSAQINSFKDE